MRALGTGWLALVCVLSAVCLTVVAGDCPNVTTDGSGLGGNMSVGPVNMTVTEGGQAVFTCSSMGSVLWLINCENSSAVDASSAVNTGNNGMSTLTFVAERSRNGARVTCVADGMLVGYAILTILYVQITGVPPSSLGSDVRLVCNATGDLSPVIGWYRASDLRSNASTLDIRSISANDGGVYTCIATSGTLNVSASTTLNILPDVSIPSGSMVEVVENQSVSLSCSVRSYPPPTITWFNPSEAVLKSVTGSSSMEQLLLNFISSPMSGGVYTCSAVSGNSSANATTTVTVLIRPRAPQYLRVVSTGSTWLLIEWGPLLPPRPHPLHDNFTVHYEGGGMQNSQTVLTGISSYNITQLLPDTEYTVKVQAVSRIGLGQPVMNSSRTLEVPPSPPPAFPLVVVVAASVAGGGGLLVVILLILITTICCCWCCRAPVEGGYVDMERKGSRLERSGSFRLSLRKPKPGDPVGDYRRASSTSHAMSVHPPIPVRGFLNRLTVMRMNDNQLFMEEFGSIPMQPQSSRDAAQLSHNKEKNRYDNILPYDHTRVKLCMVKWQHNSDYINANYLDGYMKSKAYIGTQGPIPATLGDFWRMVWEEDSRTIVMLTNTHEKGQCKCEAYWPSECDRPVTYGPIEVTMTEAVPLADYTIRTFNIIKSGAQKEPRFVKQFHFTSWPDHGVPDFPTAMLSMVRCVRAHHDQWASHGPMVVHCSAGVGRTGTFIVIDSCLQRMLSGEESMDIFAHVSLLRTQRNFMVQTEDQYFFIHEAVAEAVACGVTEVKVDLFPAYLDQLEQLVGEEADTTGIELEFRRLAIDRTEPHRFASATKEANKGKNRFVNIMPYEYNRVKLNFMRGMDGSDYINASFTDSYRCQRAFLATQGPLPDTSVDLWRMMWLHKSPVLVMLTKLVERRQARCAQYWPTEGSECYGKITVELTVTRDSGNYVYREFNMTHSESADTHVVRQFQFLGWPETGVPPSGQGLLELLQEVQNLYTTLESDKPITVMCSSGVGRTAVFIALHIILERMQREGVIDIFQTVKMLRIQRPAMVQTLELYQFCYNVVLDHLRQTVRVRTSSSSSLERKVSLRGLSTSDSSPKLVNEPADKTSTFGHTNGASQDGNLQSTSL